MTQNQFAQEANSRISQSIFLPPVWPFAGIRAESYPDIPSLDQNEDSGMIIANELVQRDLGEVIGDDRGAVPAPMLDGVEDEEGGSRRAPNSLRLHTNKKKRSINP